MKNKQKIKEVILEEGGPLAFSKVYGVALSTVYKYSSGHLSPGIKVVEKIIERHPDFVLEA